MKILSPKETEAKHLHNCIDTNYSKAFDKTKFETIIKKSRISNTFIEKIFYKVYNNNNKNSGDAKSLEYKHFKNFVIHQDKKLRDLYLMLDKNKTKKLDFDQLLYTLREFYPYKIFHKANIRHFIDNIEKTPRNSNIDFETFSHTVLFFRNKNLGYLLCRFRESSVLVNELSDAFPIETAAVDNSKAEKEASLYIKFLINLFAGGISAAISRTLTAPLDRLKTLYQVNYSGIEKPPSQIKGLFEIYNNDGVKGFFKGNLINVLKASPDTSIKFASFELLKQLYNNINQNNKAKEPTPYMLFLFGSLSGLFAAICIYPLHVIRIRFAAASTGTYKGIYDTVKKISEKEGRIKPFFSGLAASSYLIVLNSGLNLMAYDMMKSLFCSLFKTKEIHMSYLMLIGALSSAITNFICYPLQLVSTRMIMQGLKGENKTTVHVTKEIFKFEGLFGFYKGFSPLMTKLVIGSAISFSVYEKIKERILRWKNN